MPGSAWEWDVECLPASLVIAGRANGFDDAERARVLSSTGRSYRAAMIRFGLSQRRRPSLSPHDASRPKRLRRSRSTNRSTSVAGHGSSSGATGTMRAWHPEQALPRVRQRRASSCRHSRPGSS
ncbi:DUF2252 family protein [Streptomyces hirsutus]|uniref:DUF2252 family protein n=1 Tax=Streptomyces hirsutus TaxID=35620 RepID=UPI00099EF3B6